MKDREPLNKRNVNKEAKPQIKLGYDKIMTKLYSNSTKVKQKKNPDGRKKPM